MTDAGDPFKAVEEVAKAIQEGAKLGQDGVKLAHAIGHSFDHYFGSAAIEMGYWVHDRVRLARLKIVGHQMDLVAKILTRRGVEKVSQIPFRVAAPLVEEMSLEDDEFLQRMWAGLLANSLDPGNDTEPRRNYVRILGGLDPLDAKLLSFLSRQGWELMKASWAPNANIRDDVGPQGFTVKRLSEELGVDESEVRASLLNLFSVGCIRDELDQPWESMGSTSVGLRVDEAKAIFRPTQTGFDLVKACEAKELEPGK